MNKTELVNAMAAKTGMTKVAAKQAMTACFDAIQAELKKGEKVTLIGFGTFSVVKRQESGQVQSRQQAPQIRELTNSLRTTTSRGILTDAPALFCPTPQHQRTCPRIHTSGQSVCAPHLSPPSGAPTTQLPFFNTDFSG